MRSAKSPVSALPTIFARTFKRPRCAIPIKTSSTPRCAPSSINWSSSGMTFPCLRAKSVFDRDIFYAEIVQLLGFDKFCSSCSASRLRGTTSTMQSDSAAEPEITSRYRCVDFRMPDCVYARRRPGLFARASRVFAVQRPVKIRGLLHS
jgi:hypothetical protein